MINTWIRGHATPLLQIKNFLTECEYKPEFDDFPLRPIQKLLNGAEAEINKLQNEVELLKSEVRSLKKTDTPKDAASEKHEKG